jgi:hypothetical protein
MSSKKKRRKKRKSRNQGATAAQPKRHDAGRHTSRPAPETSQAAISNLPEEINRLISKGKAKAAVGKAKLYHKSLGTDESEMILVDAYAARIRELIAKGYFVEAKTLLELIRERHHCPDRLLVELNGVIAIHEGRVDELVRPLEDPGISPARRTTIERIIKDELVDLNLLARCNAISSDHPLKIGAQAVAMAFAKVASGSVRDEEIALPAISRRSPLAPWKMLIRALVYFYRQDDENCEKCLRAVDPASAPGRIVPLMRKMMAGKPGGNHGENSLLLVDQVTGSRKETQDALRMLDNALAANKPGKLLKAIRNAVKICDRNCPELLEKLKQHISIRGWLIGAAAEDINHALGGPSLKNAYFWRLYARAAERKDHNLWACAMLAEFRKHALHEGWFAEKSNEESAIYLYMADLLKALPAEDFEWLRSEFENEFGGFDTIYRDQPRSVQEAVRKPTRGPSDTYYLYPELLYRLAGEINPTAETFEQWLEWVEESTANWKECDAVAHAWYAAFPDDTRPLLYLMKSAEQRNALQKALGYLDTAERIDGLNPDVKRARLRLLAAAAVRHLKQKKTHLAQKDIAAIERLPQSREGDRPAFVLALKSVCALIDEDESEWVRLNRELATQLDYPLTAKVVLQGLLRDCGLSDRQNRLPEPSGDPLEAHDLVAALARGCGVGHDMEIAVAIPPEHEKKLREIFAADVSPHDSASIRAIAETALKNDNLELAYAAAGAGLSQPGAATAKLLLLRARSLPPWEVDRQEDCITAAIELARRARDLELIDEAVELRRSGKGFHLGFSIFGFLFDEKKSSMETEELNLVLEREKAARDYPSAMNDHFYYDFDDELDDDRNQSQCRYCDAENCPDRDTPYAPDALNGENFNDNDDDMDELPAFDEFLVEFKADLPPELMSLMTKVFSKHGKNESFPDRQEVMRKDPWLADQLLREIRKADAAGILPDFDHIWMPGWLPSY